MIVHTKSSFKEMCENYSRLGDNNYYVIGIEAGAYRIIDEKGEPTLFDSGVFDIVDESDSFEWINWYDADGARYSYPPHLGDIGFFEDYFDGEEYAARLYNQYLDQLRARKLIDVYS